MAKNGFKVMDSDMHVNEPVDLWLRYIDPAFKDRAPRGLTRWNWDRAIELEGQTLGSDPQIVDTAKAKEHTSIYEDSEACNWDPASQVRALSLEGVDVAVLYPTLGLYAQAVDGLDPALGAAIARAYNNWLYEFCSYAPDRLYGAAMLSPFEVQSAVTEARRAVTELGFKGIFIRPNIVNGRNWHDGHYDPLWAELEELDVPLGFHEGIYSGLPQVGNWLDTFMMVHTCCHPLEMMVAIVSMIGGGVLERFPRLTAAFLEGNCSWVPWLLWRLDEHYELFGRLERPDLKLEPREYFRRQCYVSIDADEKPATSMEEFGLTDNVVFSTDYPHLDAKYPHATETFLTMPLSDETKGKILWDNCARLYGFN